MELQPNLQTADIAEHHKIDIAIIRIKLSETHIETSINRVREALRLQLKEEECRP
jgi:hypothetical protein